MHSPHLLAQMSHFLMSLREQHQKLRLVQEQQANISNSKSHAANTDSDHERESNRSTSTTPLLTSPGSQQTTKLVGKNNNNNNTEQPLDLRMDSKKSTVGLGHGHLAIASPIAGKIIKNEPNLIIANSLIQANHHHNNHNIHTTVAEDENRNLIDVVSMDSPEDIAGDNANDILESDDDDMLDVASRHNDLDDMDHDIHDNKSAVSNSPPISSAGNGSVQNELLAAHSAILSRFQNAPSSNIPPEALEQVQRTLKQMLAHASAKQSRAQAAQSTSGKLERYVIYKKFHSILKYHS